LTAPTLRDLGTKFSSIDQPVGQLSGGNQQKVVFSKWLINQSRFLLLDEPSRGLDVGAKADLYKVVRELADEGLAVLVASSELDELYANCDTIWVFTKDAPARSLARAATPVRKSSMQRSKVKEGKSMSNSPAKAHPVSASEENRGRIF
jgi:ribose transport system ATP-binding protein